jgi:hypothetical protein
VNVREFADKLRSALGSPLNKRLGALTERWPSRL